MILKEKSYKIGLRYRGIFAIILVLSFFGYKTFFDLWNINFKDLSIIHKTFHIGYIIAFALWLIFFNKFLSKENHSSDQDAG